MRLSRLSAPLALVSVAAALAACGGSGDKTNANVSPSGSATASTAASSNASSGASSAATGGSSSASSADSSVVESLPPAGTVPAGAVASVAGTAITKAQFDHLYQIAQAQAKAGGQTPPKAGTAEDDQLRRQVMEVLVQNTIIQEEAKREGVAVDQAKLDKDFADFKTQCCENKDDKYQQYLKDANATEQDLKDQLAVRQIAQALYDKVTADVTVSDDEIAAQYDKDKATKYTTPESRKVAHILIDVAPTGKVTDADLKKAQEVLALVKNGGDFAKLAKQYSTDPGSKDNGGEYDDVKGQFVKEFEDAAFGLKTGEVTPQPVKSAYGYHIIKALADVKPASTKTLAEVKDEIKTALLKTAQDAKANSWFQNLLTQYEASTAFAPGYGLPPKADTSSADSVTDAAPTDSVPADTSVDTAATAPTDTASTDGTASTEDSGGGSGSSSDDSGSSSDG